MTHTPKPWTFLPPILDDKNGTIIGGHPNYESIIATVHHPIGEGETLEANAHLLAASLDLLKACKLTAAIVIDKYDASDEQLNEAWNASVEAVRKVEEKNA